MCPDCQKSAKRCASETAKLVKTPLIGKPFSRIGMDIVGPLPLSFNRNRFVLVIVLPDLMLLDFLRRSH